jgi:hypothetical protein
MAQGDIYIFNEAMEYLFDGGWEPADQIYLSLITNSPAPTQGDTTPALGDYTECSGGNYAAELLDTLGNMVTQTGGTMTFDDTGASVTWLKDGSNPQDAYYGLIYNFTDAGKAAIAYIDLAGPIDMQAGDLTITWHTSGIFTVS